MWFFVALFVASFILTAFFAPKPKTENARASALSDFQFPRANEGDPVPRIYGTVRMKSPNTIWQGDFEAQPIKKKQKTGLFSSKKVTVGFKYFVGLHLGLALGPGVRLLRIWLGKDVIWTGNMSDGSININLPELYKGNDNGNGGISGQIDFQSGSYDQTQNPYVVSKTDANYPAYVGVATLIFRHFYFGNSANIQAPNLELQYFTNSLALAGGKNVMPNGFDANPVEVLHDLYVTEWGNLGVDPGLIDTAQWRTAAYKVYDEGNGISLEIANANEGGDLTKEILRQINAMIFQDPQTGLIELKLIRQDYNLADLPILTPSNVTAIRNYTKKLWEQTYNQVRVKYSNRENDYGDAATTQQDFANINFQGRLRSTDISFPGVYVSALASQLAARELANLNVPLYSCEVEANRTVAQLRPGDPFILRWPEFEVEQMVMRIRKFGLGSYSDGKLTLNVVQDEFAVDATVIGTPGGSLHQPTVHNAITIAELKVWELPYWLDRAAALGTRDGFVRYAGYAVQPGQFSIGYSAYIIDSPDPITALSLEDYSQRARLDIAIGIWDGFDDGQLASVTLNSVAAELDEDEEYTEAEIRQGASLFMIGDEIFGYTSATDIGAGKWRLDGVYRALIDTSFAAHAVNDRVWFINGDAGFFDIDTPTGPESGYLLDVTDQQRSDPEDAEIVDLAGAGRTFAPLPPDMLTIEGERATGLTASSGDTITLAWVPRLRTADPIQFEDDAAEAAEPGTTYVARIYVGNELRQEEDGIASSPHDIIIAAEAAGDAIVRVFAKRDGVLSYTGAPFPLDILPSDDTVEIGDEIVLINGETIEAVQIGD